MYKELKENIIKFYLLEFELRFKGDSKEAEAFINKALRFGEILGQIKHNESEQVERSQDSLETAIAKNDLLSWVLNEEE